MVELDPELYGSLCRLSVGLYSRRVHKIVRNNPSLAPTGYEVLCALELLEELPSRRELWRALHKWEMRRRRTNVLNVRERYLYQLVVRYCRVMWDSAPREHRHA